MAKAREKNVRRQKSVRYNVRKNNKGSRPRLVVFRSNQHIYAQVIDDNKGVTVASASTMEKEVAEGLKSKSNTEAAAKVGAMVARRAKDASVTKIVFDRGHYLYHGCVKALADAARIGGLEF